MTPLDWLIVLAYFVVAAAAPLPDGHSGAGHQGWLFVEEVVPTWNCRFR